MSNVPYVALDEQNKALEDEILEAVRKVLRHGWYINGPEVGAFEAQLSDYLDVEHVVGVNSGTDALILALRAHGVGPGDEVVTVAHTYFATVTAIAYVGAKPVLVDVREDTMLIDARAAEAAVNERTKAIIGVHLNGYPFDIDALKSVCETHGLALIEDTAQAFGADYRGRKAGSAGTGCFSLHPLKVLAALGDAGFITTNDAELAETMRQMRSIGHTDRDHIGHISGNCRLDTLHAAILLEKMKHVDEYIAARRAHERSYRAHLRGVRLPPDHDDRAGVSCPFVIRHEQRDALLEKLLAAGIDAKIHYPVPSHLQEPLAAFGPFDLPVTDRVVSQIISLPSSPELTVEQRDLVIETVNRCAAEL